MSEPGPAVQVWITNTIVIAPPMISASLSQKRQVQARRLFVMSSSRRRASSVPKRLGHGMTRRTRMSVSPRNTTIARNVTNSDLRTLQPSWWWSQKKTSGLVMIATKVAARVRRRSSLFRDACDSVRSNAGLGTGDGLGPGAGKVAMPRTVAAMPEKPLGSSVRSLRNF